MSDYAELSGRDYERLYAKYLERPRRLLVAPDPAVPLTPETKLLDLCSGSGAVVRAAIDMGVAPRNIVALEESRAMALDMPAEVLICSYAMGDRSMWNRMATRHAPFDLITCRQAINYWWTPEITEQVIGWLAEGGCFVFNTFNTCPARVPQTKQYLHVTDEGEFQFAEIAYFDGRVVHHVQAREGMRMHLTTFYWIAPERFDSLFDLYVAEERLTGWKRIREGSTDTYVCRR